MHSSIQSLQFSSDIQSETTASAPQYCGRRAAIRCAGCRALLFKAEPGAIAGVIEIKCRRCGQFNCMRPQSPPRSPRERL
ncbi:Com family DNA-binding transcriptional regulator [Sphingobium sp.]|uniref:Com family DNA-binding transcriptional regulator n=1 Tax=Sphingobium sp. TaxID=1912891 RepID=UPI0039B943A3